MGNTRGPEPMEYSEAVAFAKERIQMWQRGPANGWLAGRDLTDNRIFRDVTDTTLGASMLRNRPCDLFTWAQESAEGFDVLCLGVAEAVASRQSEELTPQVRAWLSGYLRGDVKRPKARAGRGQNVGLSFVIWATVRDLETRCGLHATRNDAPNQHEPEEKSACDAVAAALQELGMLPASFHGVKRIWIEMKQREAQAIPPT